MAVLTAPPTQDAHWYHANGTPQHTMPLKSGDGVRNTNLADARKLGLYPSVSGIIGMLYKGGLEKWKINQAILATLRIQKKDDQPEKQYCDMIRDAAHEQVDDAADFGTAIHAEIEKFLKWDPSAGPFVPSELALDFVKPTLNWMLEKGIKIQDPEKVVVNHAHGFAGTSDAPYKSPKSFGILDYKTKRTTPGKKIDEFAEKLLQISAYFATYWGEQALADPRAWGGNIYISSTERGRTVAIMYNSEMLSRGWEVFKSLCGIWRHFNEFDPRLPAGQPQTWPSSIIIEIAPALPMIGATTVAPVVAPDLKKTAAPSPESPSVPSSPTTPAPTETQNSDETRVITKEEILQALVCDGAVKLQDEADGIRFLKPLTCYGFTEGRLKTIYSWWYHRETNSARVNFSADASMMEHGWVRTCKAYAADLDMENRVAGKKDPETGTNGLPVKPATANPSQGSAATPIAKVAEPALVSGPSLVATPTPSSTSSSDRVKILEGMVMGFGKHRKVLLREAPSSYLDWCRGQLDNEKSSLPPHVIEYLRIPSVNASIDQDLKRAEA